MEKKELFVPETRRDPKLYLRFSDSTIRYIFHPSFSPAAYGLALENRPVLDWPEKTDQWCIHDGHPFETRPIPIPISYDAKTGRMEVSAGVCCSGPCLKRYIMDQNFLVPLRMAITKLMLSEVFGLPDSVPVAPPRHMLKNFGGPYTLAEFRGAIHTIHFRAAPFITRDMIFEEGIQTERQQQAPAVFVDDTAAMPVPLPALPPAPPRKNARKPAAPKPAKNSGTAGSLLSLLKKPAS